MLPDYITAYLDEQSIPHDDLDAGFRQIRLDQLDMQIIAMMIGDPNYIDIADVDYERWQTLGDVLATVRKVGSEVDQKQPWKVGV